MLTDDVGKYGENLAASFLAARGYRVLDRNYRKPWGELDIVLKAPDGTLVFVEVKALSGNPEGLIAEDHLTAAKLKKLRRTAELYVNENEKFVREDRGWRIDLVAISFGVGEPEIAHYENI